MEKVILLPLVLFIDSQTKQLKTKKIHFVYYVLNFLEQNLTKTKTYCLSTSGKIFKETTIILTHTNYIISYKHIKNSF